MDFLGILEVAIGIVLVYLVLSLVCTAAMEALDGNLLRIRPGVLNDLVERLVGYSIARQVFDSEEVRVLAKSSDTKPSYIPTEVFAHSILEIAAGEDWRKLANTPTVLREKLVAYGETTEEQAREDSGQKDSEEDVEENAAAKGDKWCFSIDAETQRPVDDGIQLFCAL